MITTNEQKNALLILLDTELQFIGEQRDIRHPDWRLGIPVPEECDVDTVAVLNREIELIKHLYRYINGEFADSNIPPFPPNHIKITIC